MVRNQIDRWWNKVEQRHERSGIGSLIRPEDIYLRPEILQGLAAGALRPRSRSARRRRCARRRRNARRDRHQHAPHAALPRLHPRAHRAVAEAHAAETRIVIAAPNQGDVERTGHRAARVPDSLSPRQPRRSPRRNRAGRSQLPGRRSARARHRAHAACRRRQLSRIQPDPLRRQRSLRRSRRRRAPRAASNPKPRPLSPIFATSPSAIMWSTSSTASRSIRASRRLCRTASPSSS